jgi:hypothetical protein
MPVGTVLVRIAPQRFPMTFHITLETAEDAWIVAECPALPGCVSQGKDEEEAINNIREANHCMDVGRGSERNAGINVDDFLKLL